MSDDFTTEDFIWQLKNSPDPDERLYAAFKLGRDKQPIVVQPLIDASDDAVAEVRVRVAEALGTREDALLVLPALLKLLKDDEPVVRRTAAVSMGHLAAPDSVAALCIALSDSDDTVRSHVAEALGEIASDDSAKALVEAFLHDEDANVRYFAKQSLGKVGRVAVDALVDVVAETDDPDLLIEVCEILGNLGDSRAKVTLHALSEHDNEHVAEMATWALQRIRT